MGEFAYGLSCLIFKFLGHLLYIVEPQVPRSPDSVLPKIVNNCTIDLHLSWGQPASDLAIGMYCLFKGIGSQRLSLILEERG